MYIWSFIAHVVLPLGEVGVHQMPNEQPVLAALSASVGDNHGLYLFPRMEAGASLQQYQQKLAGQEPPRPPELPP